MLGVLCARPKPWSHSLSHVPAAPHPDRLFHSPVNFGDVANSRRRQHSSACKLAVSGGVAASIWHAILPSGGCGGESRRPPIHHDQKGEGSWNVAWDARPARWLHSPDSAWLLFGVCACLAPLDWTEESAEVAAVVEDKPPESCRLNCSSSDESSRGSSADYRVTGVLADGRCLFRAIAHCACLRNGEEAPDENRQRELADELRGKVVDELVRRREETELFIEGDFDAYIKKIQQPYEWGGEPELLMASHVLQTPISVFRIDRSSDGLEKIADYGNIYQKEKDSPINVLFHGYGHYDILETSPDQSYQKSDTE